MNFCFLQIYIIFCGTKENSVPEVLCISGNCLFQRQLTTIPVSLSLSLPLFEILVFVVKYLCRTLFLTSIRNSGMSFSFLLSLGKYLDRIRYSIYLQEYSYLYTIRLRGEISQRISLRLEIQNQGNQNRNLIRS